MFFFQSMNVVMGSAVLKESCVGCLLDIFQQNDVKYEFTNQAREDIVTVWRETTQLQVLK